MMDIKNMYTMELYAYVFDRYGSHHSLATLGITDTDTHSIITETQLHDVYKEWCTRHKYKWHASKASVYYFFANLFATTMVVFFGNDETMFTRTREHPPRIRFNHKYIITLRGAVYSSRVSMEDNVIELKNAVARGETVSTLEKYTTITEHPVLRLLCNRARVMKQKKTRNEYLKNYSLSSIPADNLKITDFMSFNEKIKRADMWKKAFASLNPPEVIDIHREFTNITHTLQLVDVTLSIDSRQIRIEHLPATILPCTKRPRN
ncbi:hypothetical protein EXVG_00455 [Emiliania huxleyi virus 202]|nr:hypothetical protein EXVG_00455 [Emiliania huxleyi virus 202]AHA55341.1 putative membrane protein [Emiliania huxleyi virus 156]